MKQTATVIHPTKERQLIFTEDQVRKAAVVICRYTHNVGCIMDEKPPRPPCTLENCEVMRLAQSVLCVAGNR